MKIIVATLAGVLSLVALAPAQAATTSVTGTWNGPGGFGVVIAPCSDHGQAKLCGKITSLSKPLDAHGHPKTDEHNPDPVRRALPLIGSTFLSGFIASGEGHWVGGSIYDPDSGRTYDSKMTLIGDDQLKVDGCVLIICKGQVWQRATGPVR